MNAGQSTLLFVDLFQLPMNSLQNTVKKPRGVWEARELEFEPVPEPSKMKKTPVVEPKTGRKPKDQKTRITGTGLTGEVGTVEERAALNDIHLEQSFSSASLVRDGGELGVCTASEKWHSQTTENVQTDSGAKVQLISPPFPLQTEHSNHSRTPELKMATTNRFWANEELPLDDNGEPLFVGSAVTKCEAATLTATENIKNETYGQSCYRYPRVFVLLSQIAYLAEVRGKHKDMRVGAPARKINVQDDDEALRIGTDHLLSRARDCSDEIRRALYRNLQVANDLQLINRKDVTVGGRSLTSWELTSEGKLFLMAGIKIRNAMRKVANYSDEEICSFVSNDEVEDWKLDAQDREEKLALHFGSGKKRHKSEMPEVSRTELALAIEQQAVQKVQSSDINNLWSGLVR